MQAKMLLRLVAIVCVAPKVHAISASAAASDQSADAVQAASVENGGLVTEGVATLDGQSLDAVAEGRSAEAVMSTSIPKTNWTVTVDSYQPDHPPSNILDDNLDTFWHTTYTPGAPPSARTGVSKFQHCVTSASLAPELVLQPRVPNGGKDADLRCIRPSFRTI